MGLFNRKNTRISTNGDRLASNADSLKSPPPNKATNGVSFDPSPMTDIQLPGPPDPTLDPAAYLRSIYAVRQRSRYIIVNAKRNQLSHFDVDSTKWKDTVDYVTRIIKVRISQHTSLTIYTDTLLRETSLQTIAKSHPTDDGSTSKQVVVQGLTSYWLLGLLRSTIRNEHAV